MCRSASQETCRLLVQEARLPNHEELIVLKHTFYCLVFYNPFTVGVKGFFYKKTGCRVKQRPV